MARFDKSKDVCVKSWFIGDPDDKHLEVSVMQYNGGELKMQVIRKFRRANGQIGFGKMGRLSLDETIALGEILPEVRALMGEPVSAVMVG